MVDNGNQGSNGDGRVTIAILGAKVDNLTATLCSYINEQHKINEKMDERILCLEREGARQGERIRIVSERDTVGTVATALGTAVALILGVFGIK